MQNFIKIHEKDNVAVALHAISQGTSVQLDDSREIVIGDDIPAGHKFALMDI